jgi:signal transduction histidine kinase/ligand-binding sensor domain-containing protein/DNA-binding response OmpR family regulator
MREICKKSFTLLFFLIIPIAYSQNYNFSHLNIEDGLSHNSVRCILKDSKGFMWFGTSIGLNRYDGKSFKNFLPDPGDSTSISNSEIFTINEDPKGRIWVGTYFGLNIYDPTTESFIRNTAPVLNEYAIPTTEISKILKDGRGNWLFIGNREGIFIYSSKSKKSLSLENNPNDTTSIVDNAIADINVDHKGFYWIIHLNGVIEKLDPRSKKVVKRIKNVGLLNGKDPVWYVFSIDKDGDLWIRGKGNTGMIYLSPEKNIFKILKKGTPGTSINSNIIGGVEQAEDDKIWIATDHGGINVLDKKDFSVRYLLYSPNNEKGISDNSLLCMYKDVDGMIWVGTSKSGIDYYHHSLSKFNLIKPLNYPHFALKYEDINCFEEDGNGNLWIGSNDGGLSYYDRSTNEFTYFNNPLTKSAHLPAKVIKSLLRDRSGSLWIGTYTDGLYRYNGKTFTNYKHDPSDPNSISSNDIWDLFEDSDGNLWIGTNGSGLEMFDRKELIFHHYTSMLPNSIHHNFITSITEDKHKNIWVGTSYGVDILEKNSNKFTQYIYDPKNPKTIVGSSIICLLLDSRGYMWVGTKEGISLFNERRDIIKNFTTTDGLPSNYISSILEDKNGNMWVSTSNGLSNIIITSKRLKNDLVVESGYSLMTTSDRYSSREVKNNLIFTFRNYTERDGLQGRFFNENAGFKTSKNELVFGGPNGFNIFNPEDIEIKEITSKIVFTGLQVFNTEVKPGDKINNRVILQKSIVETEELILKSQENVFAISFAALNSFRPENNKFEYKLKGFEENWNRLNDDQNRITYTNLNPGKYTLEIRSYNNNGISNSDSGKLNIIILPPFYKTKIAYAIYFIAILLLLYIARKLIIRRTREKIEIEQAKREANRIHEIDRLKIKFLTNISHEFKTPLSLILAPIERLLDNQRNEDLKNQYTVIQRNAKRLMNLVNQLLDFRKIEVQETSLSLSEGDIVSAIRESALSFSDISEKKNIQLTFQSNLSKLNTAFDADKLERIIFNLLSNAFKFTPEGGKISIEVKYFEDSTLLGEVSGSVAKIVVKDNGIGIPDDKKKLIFERFFQYDSSQNVTNPGSGIGLSITREFVQLHGGKIFAEDGNPGTVFTVLIPVKPIEISAEIEINNINSGLQAINVHSDSARKASSSQKQTVLIVEDNEDFRFYLKNNLKEHFHIIEAADGMQGLEMAIRELPQLIVSDVMMPKMDGLQLSKKIRNDIKTSHIPVVLLTARSEEEQKIEGYESGASEYITKPFNYKILLSRITTLIAERELVKRSFQKNIEISPSEISVTPLDQKLVAKAIDIVEKNINNSDFSVEEMGKELGMSRSHLYNKINSLTGKTPIEFIRLIRVKRAAQLLEKSQLTVAEVSYAVGINNLRYFAKHFKSEFNELPSQYAKRFKDQSRSL